MLPSFQSDGFIWKKKKNYFKDDLNPKSMRKPNSYMGQIL